MVIDEGSWMMDVDVKLWLKPHSRTIKNGLTSTKLSIKSPFLLIKLKILNLDSRLLTLDSWHLIFDSFLRLHLIKTDKSPPLHKYRVHNILANELQDLLLQIFVEELIDDKANWRFLLLESPNFDR